MTQWTSVTEPEKRAMDNIPECEELPSFDGLVDDTVREIIDVELATFGDHCLMVHLRPLIARALKTAIDRCG